MTARSLIFLPSILLPALAFAQQTPQSPTEAELTSLLAIYKDIHAHPELSMHEERSASIVAKELKAAGCEVTERVGKYEKPGATCFGVVGVMKNGAGPTVLARTDLDALPVHEETGLPYASTVTTKNDEGKEVPVMHACGHDAHISMFIGVARVLAKLKDQWHGTIVFVAQPAEETGNGARALLRAGLYEKFGKPNFALGFHDKADMQTGHIGVTEGYTYANVDSVDVIVRGVGGHGAYPHKTKDPIVLAAEMINTWQTIASRENNPLDPIVVTVGSIHGGTKHNIIPDEVKMQLTVRTYKPETRERVLAAIDQIAKGCAMAAGIPPDRAPIVSVAKDQFTPATYNNPELTKRLLAAWKKTLGNENVEIVDATMGGEDFSEYSLPDHSIPAVDFHIGAVDPVKIADSKKNGTMLPSLHSSKFAPVPEPTIRTGIIAMTAAVLELTKK
ncbi:MAG: amidohydrolase [Verrucomicrobia bacterium]|nr:MAG: amidohydrolase [Verrucomicrobiota bacterium]PYJ44497.1 MAG: amidohydrolase [Verrucomicrobiota bacterium]PYL54824.1 MAG: amidohydrolase [Verrucomicrobiota bacterium]